MTSVSMKLRAAKEQIEVNEEEVRLQRFKEMQLLLGIGVLRQ